MHRSALLVWLEVKEEMFCKENQGRIEIFAPFFSSLAFVRAREIRIEGSIQSFDLVVLIFKKDLCVQGSGFRLSLIFNFFFSVDCSFRATSFECGLFLPGNELDPPSCFYNNRDNSAMYLGLSVWVSGNNNLNNVIISNGNTVSTQRFVLTVGDTKSIVSRNMLSTNIFSSLTFEISSYLRNV